MKIHLLLSLLISLFFTTSTFAADTNKQKPTHNEDSTLIRKNYPNLPAPSGPYSIVVRHNNTLYLSGITAFGTPAQDKGMAEQAKAIFEQIKQITQAEGIGMRELIKVTIYVTSTDDITTLRQLLSEQYEGHNPASSLIHIAGLAAPELNIEIEAIFAIPQ